MKKTLVLLLAFALGVLGCPTGPVDVGVPSSPDAGHRLGSFSPTATGTGIPHVVSGVQASAASTIVDADVSSSAAIAGTKVSPSFGSQNIITSGNVQLGTAPVAGTGLLRTPYNAGTLWSNRASDASEAPLVRAGVDTYYFGSVAVTNVSGSTVSLCPGGADVAAMTVTSSQIGIFQPINGGGTSPYAMNGQDNLAFAGSASTLTLAAADYSNASIAFTGARTAVATITIPAATNAQAYFKWFQNSTTGGFTLTLTTGSGTTQALGAGGTPHLFRVDGSGIVLLL